MNPLLILLAALAISAFTIPAMLRTAPQAVALNQYAEGQWLLPELSAAGPGAGSAH